MVLIPGGEFVMGKEEYADHGPEHTVRIDPFYMDKHEVTNAEYLKYCEETDHRLPEFWGMAVFRSGPEFANHPVVGVSWSDAMKYAQWRGARLPTEAEWEYAARGGLVGKNFSHGDDLDSTLYAPGGFTGEAGPLPVGSFPPNGYGLYDMTRNVTEWVRDWYDPDYYKTSPAANPPGPGHGKFRVIRGGGWHTGPYCSRVYIRTALQSNWLDFNVGFRCARSKGESAASEMERIILETGIEEALAAHTEMKAAAPGEYFFDEFEFNEMGYRLLKAEKVTEAIEVFKLNTEAFPASYNAFDSLAEAYLTKGDREQAIENYRKSLQLNPGNRGGREKMQELEER
jgi:iron(II)-dependent oxidoreductase